MKIASIGKNSEIRPYCTIIGTQNIIIGDNVIIPERTTLVCVPGNMDSLIYIEDDVLFGPNVSVYSSTHNFMDVNIAVKYQGYKVAVTRIKKGAWIGINSVILPGVTIGLNSVIGANSVVNHDVPDYTVVAGAPAKIIKNLD